MATSLTRISRARFGSKHRYPNIALSCESVIQQFTRRFLSPQTRSVQDVDITQGCFSFTFARLSSVDITTFYFG